MSYHFIGIGGIGMSSLAKLLLLKNKKVKGSDINVSEMTEDLKKRGAKIYEGHKKENIDSDDIIIYSTAIAEENEELSFARQKKLKVFHRSELLKNFIEKKFSILISGTHGKTTTSSLLTEVLLDAEVDPSYALGGILKLTNTNADLGESKFFIIEVDESDGSFLNYEGDIAIITNIEKEHLNYWKNLKNLKKGFSSFIDKIKRKKDLIWCKEDPILNEISPMGISYGFSKDAKIYADNIREENFSTLFDIHFDDKTYSDIRLNLLGKHNVLNALAVFGLARCLNISKRNIFKTFATFNGVKRRLDKIGEKNKAIFFDDYGHHPSEIKATLNALRDSVKEKRIICVFQPHRYSRTKELFDEFCHSFDYVDHLIITDIYSAGEKNTEIISSKKLIETIEKKSFYVEKTKLKQELLNIIKPHDVVIFFGAGDITKIGREIFSEYKNNPSKLKLSLLFGGKSSEHEVSQLSAKNIYNNLDPSIYDITPFYISKEGLWSKADANLKPIDDQKEVFSKEIFEILNKSDVCFPIFHGPCGEDGMIQGFLDTLEIPYVGPSYAACSCSMNKAWVKYIAKENDINTAKFSLKGELALCCTTVEHILSPLQFPFL